MNEFDILLWLAERCATGKAVIKTGEAAEQLHYSQQSISRLLRALEKKGLIERTPSNTGVGVELTENAWAMLRKYRDAAEKILASHRTLIGSVVTGSGEGAFYTELPGYKRQFKKKLGIANHPGTLNLRVDVRHAKDFASNAGKTEISGFKNDKRSFGAIKAIPVLIENVGGAILIPERTHHSEDILEIISERNLRKALRLRDGSKVKVCIRR